MRLSNSCDCLSAGSIWKNGAADLLAGSPYYCFIPQVGWSLCYSGYDPIEVHAPPPPPEFDDCSSSPDPGEEFWCECWQYSDEPFWCESGFEYEDWPVFPAGSENGGDGSSFSVTLNCSPASVARGSNVSCTAAASGGPLLITKWEFHPESGSGLDPVTNSSSDSTWYGVIVISGTVTVEAMVGGDSTITRSAIVQVGGRAAGIWTQTHWQSQLSFTAGQGSTVCSPWSRPINGEPFGWIGSLSGANSCQGQMLEPIGGAGYSISEGSGPNAGYWYLESVSFFVHSTSQLHPGVFPGAPANPVTNQQQASECGASINFYDFNSCKGVPGWIGFIPAAWAHEQEHFENVEIELLKPGNNIYLELESVVRPSQFAASSAVTQRYNIIQQALELAGSNEPTGNWTTSFWIWASDMLSVFLFVDGPNF